MTLGYLKQEQKTREAYAEEDGVRWFYTGDIGLMESDGVLRIIGKVNCWFPLLQIIYSQLQS